MEYISDNEKCNLTFFQKYVTHILLAKVNKTNLFFVNEILVFWTTSATNDWCVLPHVDFITGNGEYCVDLKIYREATKSRTNDDIYFLLL